MDVEVSYVEQLTVFPQYVWKFNTKLDCEELGKRCIETYHKEMENCQFYSNVGGWQSPVDMYKEGKGFEDVRDVIVDRMCIVCQAYDMKGHWALNSLWINLNYPDAFNRSHDHLKVNEHAVNLLSGVLWITIPKDSGQFQFINCDCQQELHEYFDNENTRNFSKHDITPSEGEGYIFNASKKHLVTRNESELTRISMSFNFELLDPSVTKAAGIKGDQVVLFNK